MEEQRIAACQKVIRHIKADIHKIRDFSPLQSKVCKSQHCERLAKDIKENLIRLYTFDEIDYVVNALGKNMWNDVLYYVNMFNKTNNHDDLEY